MTTTPTKRAGGERTLCVVLVPQLDAKAIQIDDTLYVEGSADRVVLAQRLAWALVEVFSPAIPQQLPEALADREVVRGRGP